MNWNDPRVQLSLKDLREMLDARGRDSRLVRAAFRWSRTKKKFLERTKQWFYGLKSHEDKKGAPIRVLFWLVGGLGDAACAKRLVAAYREMLPMARFDIYSGLPGVAQALFGADLHTHILKDNKICWADYDLAAQVCLSIKFLHVNEERFSALAPSFLPVLERAQRAQKSLGSLLEDIFLTESILGRWLYANGGQRFDLLSYTGGTEISEEPNERIYVPADALKRWDLAAGTYVTFHDGTSEAQQVGKTRPTRAWPRERWREFLRLFKKDFPHIKLVQLGGSNSPVYPEADVNLVGKTNVTDLPGLMSGAKLHIDTESGLVHLAQYLDVKSIVLFGPSSVPFFGYGKNRNIAAGPCGGCMWTTTDWMFKCPLGKKESSCMENVSAQTVLKEVAEEMAR